ncbi:UDP-2,4-diacetamido-2,4,6-trideoxy-beta-L-altropyranose hydrolase [Paludibacterium yongneupense]|uniref:UDP-2,4-diacetamido-2,4, 6-trideoxy-beta-L-altropyranose hydrolase n=1 Tax=Paludibacterium yongneupense TaxID=400061 RepID=UPI00041DC544|nr:UDP-2,4-diacetamido-2,4,6-trideoxy-beta-L-altropyranose hydrolase [Paludibacterium yongneupense]
MPTIVFRADASTTVGAGHIVRCATLAHELSARGARVVFICRETTGNFCAWLAEQKFDVHRLSGGDADWRIDALGTREIVDTLGKVDWLVVDHYALDARWERALRVAGVAKVAVIDDLDNREHDCDLLLDQNYSVEGAERYRKHVPAEATVLLGPSFALLAPQFRIQRTLATARLGAVRRVIVCFGGADSANFTAATLQALAEYAGGLERIDVVAGAANPHRATLETLCRQLPNTVLHPPTDTLAELMAEADLAIGAGGTMNWERACLGLPTLAFGIADNQAPVLDALLEGGYVLGCSRLQEPDVGIMGAWLASALSSPALLHGISKRGLGLVDGQGVLRVADHLMPVVLTFQPATSADSADLLCWRNHADIRRASLDSHEIGSELHESWLARTLEDPNRILLIARLGGRPVGVVRFDLALPDALVSVYRVPGTQTVRCGLVSQASAWLRRCRPDVRRIVAEILPANSASLAAFSAAGYRGCKFTFVLDLDAS